MSAPDFVNGLFELFGAFANWQNVKALLRDKEVKGVSIMPTVFFSLWGLWNLWYYPSLQQWFSFAGGVAIVTVNTVWVVLALVYASRRERERYTSQANPSSGEADWRRSDADALRHCPAEDQPDGRGATDVGQLVHETQGHFAEERAASVAAPAEGDYDGEWAACHGSSHPRPLPQHTGETFRSCRTQDL